VDELPARWLLAVRNLAQALADSGDVWFDSPDAWVRIDVRTAAQARLNSALDACRQAAANVGDALSRSRLSSSLQQATDTLVTAAEARLANRDYPPAAIDAARDVAYSPAVLNEMLGGLAPLPPPPTGDDDPSSRKAASSGQRLEFDDYTRTVTLDGVPDDEQLDPDCYQFLKAVGRPGRCGTRVPGRLIADAPGLKGKKLVRVFNKLPRRWRDLIDSQSGSGGGYCLTLPCRDVPRRPRASPGVL
jgi:hypothetical protein